MSRVSIGRRAVTMALSSLMLMAASLIPLAGTVGAAQTSTNCTSDPTCFLKISSPSSVQTGLPFTVNVLVTTDGSTIAKSDPCGSTALVHLIIFVGEEGTAFDSTAIAKKGVATFNVTLVDPGTYDAHATATSSKSGCDGTSYEDDFKTIEAVTLNPGEPMAPCPPDTNCVQVTSGTGTQATLIADPNGNSWGSPGFVGSLPDEGNCSGPPLDPGNGVLSFTLTGTTTVKTIVFALDSQLVNQGIGKFNVCWSQPTPFKDKNGNTVTTGDLPDCKGGTLPCVASKTSGQHNVAFITVHADPNAGGDPFGYGH